MKIVSLLIALICGIQGTLSQSSAFPFVYPKPNSKFVSIETNIIIKSAVPVDGHTITAESLHVVGSVSGRHTGTITLSDDERTIVFVPDVPFVSEEHVNVAIRSGMKGKNTAMLSDCSFSFTTMPKGSTVIRQLPIDDGSLDATTGYLPAPPITIDSVNNPTAGYIFLATWDRNVPLHKYANYLFILDHNGKIIDSTRVNGAPFDFQIQPNGRLSYGLGDYSGITPGNSNLTHYVLDSTLALVDSFQMKNGYLTDFHDFILLPNGHAMLMSYHTVTMDMSTIAPGGKPDAQVVINVFQEQDAEKNVVFEWRDIDYIPITDTDLKLTDPRINPSTLNAFELDYDGNLLLSFRNHSDIVKISRETGEILCRLGGLKNEFTFIGEHTENAPYYFSRQHDIHRLPNGNISLFDNGEFHAPWYSRGVEYSLDEITKTATLVSEYRYASGDISVQAAGNAHRLDNGGWFLGYGILNPTSQVKRNLVEAHADGTTAFELSLPANVISYRASKQAWRQYIPKITVSNAEVLQGNTYSFDKDGKITGIAIRYAQLNGDIYNNVTITRMPYGPVHPEFISQSPSVAPVSLIYGGAAITSHTSELHISLSAFPEIHHPSMTSLYIREFAGQGLFLQIPTSYDSVAHELIGTTTKFGEIIFGNLDVNQVMTNPVLIEPLNGKKILAANNPTLQWSGRGSFQAFQLHIAADSAFNVVILDSLVSTASVNFAKSEKGKTYFWRVRSTSGNSTSSWSAVWHFTPVDPFISVVTPIGGETFKIGSSVIVRWDTNIPDSIRLILSRGSNVVGAIGKSLGKNNAYLWNISGNTIPDSTYSLKIVSVQDSSIVGFGTSVFSLTNTTYVEEKGENIPHGYALCQNYPNPFNPSTTITYQLSDDANVVLLIHDILGKKVAELVNERQTAGLHSVVFRPESEPNGIYFYTIRAGSFTDTKKLLLLK